ncbi:MAG: hypothetical protein HY735_07390 [Verrucomicrobia bacterium]|nr:hypothetical protein [Verrucomicrobiota bacterium]
MQELSPEPKQAFPGNPNPQKTAQESRARAVIGAKGVHFGQDVRKGAGMSKMPNRLQIALEAI